ncbi:MAG TPA: hypothetical protein VKA94_09255 [Hyphomicrobiales bacterium]|nr:hypothetical protein [Hyphomicrobiales bacterium]
MLGLNSTKLALTAASFFALAASANASDLGIDGRTDLYEPAPTQAVVDWSGIVLGGIVGYNIVNYDLEHPHFTFDGVSGRGFQGCGLLGVQKQAGIIVIGVEGRGCGSNTATDLNGKDLDLDYSYAGYGKIGVADDDFLASILAGYAWQHVEFAPANFDDTIEGFSGGIVFEHKLGSDNSWAIGLEGLFTQFEEQEAKSLNIDPTKYEANIRLTYTIGQ